MSLTSLLVFPQHILQTSIASRTVFRCYAAKSSTTGAAGMIPTLGKKRMGKGPILEKKVLPVETDPHRLVNYVCGSDITTACEDIKIKDDSEYPDWLFALPLGPPPPMEEMDPNTHEYWYFARKQAIKRQLRLQKLKKF